MSSEDAVRAVAERKRVEAAAQRFRRQVAQDTYAGGRRPEVAYSLVSIVDMMALDWRSLDESLRHAVLSFVNEVERPDPADRPGPATGRRGDAGTG